MFKVKLTALEHPRADNINLDDPKEFRELVLWLEDQKIRQYKIEDRGGLREVSNLKTWEEAFEKYKRDLGCPELFRTQTEALGWILGFAVKLEYGDHVDKFQSACGKRTSTETMPTVKSTNPFDNLDFSSKEFETGVRQLALMFDLPYHPDHLVVLQGVSRLVKNNFSVEALKEQVPTGKPYPIFEGEGFDLGNADLEKAARILRLLQVQNVRELQTVINETIVAVQNVTADPKTDTKLGKVGY